MIIDQNILLPVLSLSEWLKIFKCNPSLYKEIVDDIDSQRYSAIFIENGRSYSIPYRLGYSNGINLFIPNSLELEPELIFVIEQLFLTRHYNGFKREQAVKQLLKPYLLEKYPCITPYLFRLLGEYVREIWQVIFHSYEMLITEHLRAFITLNPLFIQKTVARTITYTKEYYSHEFPDYTEAEGFRTIQLLTNIVDSV